MTRGDKAWIVGAMTGASMFGLAVGRWTSAPTALADEPSTRPVTIMPEKEAKILTAKEFRLVDAKGRIMGVLACRGIGASLWLHDADANLRLSLTTYDGQPHLEFYDVAGHKRFSLSEHEIGILMSMLDSKEHPRVLMSVLDDGESMLTFADEKAVSWMGLGLSKNGSDIFMHAPGRKQHCAWQTTSDGRMDLVFVDDAGKARVSVGMSDSGTPEMLIDNDAGRTVWSAP